MKKILALLSVLACMLIIAGCEEAAEKTIDSDTSSDGIKTKTTVTTDEGEKVVVEGNAKNTDSWCQAGSEWKATATESTTKMIIVGLETSSKYAGLCHVTYDIAAEGKTINADYYFSQDGASGYQVMDIGGQKIESEWSK